MDGKNYPMKMKLPTQSAPVDRRLSKDSYVQAGVSQSDNCGCPIVCIGGCVFGHCLGYCI